MSQSWVESVFKMVWTITKIKKSINLKWVRGTLKRIQSYELNTGGDYEMFFEPGLNSHIDITTRWVRDKVGRFFLVCVFIIILSVKLLVSKFKLQSMEFKSRYLRIYWRLLLLMEIRNSDCNSINLFEKFKLVKLDNLNLLYIKSSKQTRLRLTV